MRRLTVTTIFAVAAACGPYAATAAAQRHPHATPPSAVKPGHTRHLAPSQPAQHQLHQSRLRLSPQLAFHHLRDGAERAAAHRVAALREKKFGSPHPRKTDDETSHPQPRPIGAGPHIAAVITCADGPGAIHQHLNQREGDVLLVRNPGPVLRLEEIAMIEEAVQQDKLSLCVILTHSGCRSAARRSSGPRTGRRGPTALQPADRAIALSRSLLSRSKVCAAAERDDLFAVVAGTIDAKGNIRWVGTALRRPPGHVLVPGTVSTDTNSTTGDPAADTVGQRSTTDAAPQRH